MDDIILEAFPLIAAKQSNHLETSVNNGTRYIVTAKGLMREIKLPWIEIRHSIAEVSKLIRLPYGHCEESINFLCGPIPGEPIRQFISHAREKCPNEIAGAILWNQNTYAWRYARREPLQVTPAYINYKEVHLEEGECLVVDVHSHGRFDSFFSSQDDRDDMGTMRLALVAGNLDKPVITTCMRLCMAGYVVPVVRHADGSIEVVSHG